MRKDFLHFDTVRNNALSMAHRIHQDGFVPDIIYVLLRGGAYIGNIISEYFKIIRKDSRPVFYAAVVARSYTDIMQHDQVMVDGWTYSPEYLRNGDRVLIVDDIFDSGRTINHLTEIILAKGIPRNDIRVAVHDYKEFTFNKKVPPIRPDYYCRKHIVEDKDNDIWIHYMSHELVGLSAKEVEEHYGDLDPALKEVLADLDE